MSPKLPQPTLHDVSVLPLSTSRVTARGPLEGHLGKVADLIRGPHGLPSSVWSAWVVVSIPGKAKYQLGGRDTKGDPLLQATLNKGSRGVCSCDTLPINLQTSIVVKLT